MSHDQSRKLPIIDVFHELSADGLSLVGSLLRPLALPAAHSLLTTGEIDPSVFFILSGTVCIYRPQQDGSRFILNLVGAGEMLGEVCALDHQGHSASAVTTEACTLLRMRRSDFNRCEQEMPRLSHNVKLLLTRRLRFATSHSEALVPHDAQRRVARMLLAFANRYSTRIHPDCGKSEVLIPLRLTQGDLGDLCALTRQCVCGHLGEMIEAGLIESLPRYRIKILDHVALQAIC